LAAFGYSVSAARVRPQIGKGGKELLRDFVEPVVRHFLGSAIGATETDLFLRDFARVRPVPGAARTVRAMLRDGIAVVLASSAERRVVERSLSLLRLKGVVTRFTSADDVRKAKPFEDVFRLAITRFRLGGRRPLAIGDTPYDIAAAHQLGIPCVALDSGGFPPRELACAEARFPDLAAFWAAARASRPSRA
jgi:beta-phosphoglucomutase-like phosphatase (HAD superfamily)